MRLLLLLFLLPGVALSQNSANAGTNVAGTGVDWNNATNITASDNNRAATATTTTFPSTSDVLLATNFGFNLGVTDVVNGIEVSFQKRSGAASVAMASSAWSVSSVSPFNVTCPNTGADKNRILIVVIGFENENPRDITSVTYGGQTLTQAVDIGLDNGFYARTEIWYLKEAQISTATSNFTSLTRPLTYTYAAGPVLNENFEIVSAAFYRNVDQVSPVIDTETGTSTTTTANSNFQLPNAMTTNEGSMSIVGIFCGNAPASGGLGNVDGYDEPVAYGYTQRLDYQGANSGASTSGGVLFVGERVTNDATVYPPNNNNGTTQPVLSFNGSPNRQTIAGISLRRMRNFDASVKVKKNLLTYAPTEMASLTNEWSTKDVVSGNAIYTTYGGPSQLWGTTWLFTDINSSDFGAGISGTINNTSLQVNHVRIRVYTSSVLPLELVSFGAQQTGKNVICNWITATERDTEKFLVERSSDGENFEAMSILPAAGNSTAAIDYQFIDEHPLAGVGYYRLTTVDKDGAVTKSEVVSVNYSSSNEVTIYPNPANAWATVMTSEGFDEIVITDVNGQLIDRFQGTSLQTEQELNINHMPDGTYFVCIKSHDGTVKIEKLMITSREQ